jgi:hypothetical protein
MRGRFGKGKLNIAGGTEFGYKVAVADEEQGFVTAYAVYARNPEDGTALIPTVDRHIALLGRAPHAVATDRGMTSGGNERALSDRGVVRCSLPRPGKKGPTEDTRRDGSDTCSDSAPGARRGSVSSSVSTAGAEVSCVEPTEPRRGSVGASSPNLTRYARLEILAA